jgi:hypothetical protein
LKINKLEKPSTSVGMFSTAIETLENLQPLQDLLETIEINA